MKKLKKIKIGSPEIYQEFTELYNLKYLYETDKEAFQKMALEWDKEYRDRIKSMIYNYRFMDSITYPSYLAAFRQFPSVPMSNVAFSLFV